MNNLFSIFPKKTRLLIIGLLGVIALLILIRFTQQKNQTPPSSALPVVLYSPIPSTNTGLPDKNHISSLQKTKIGETTVTYFAAQNTGVKKTTENGNIKYSIPSVLSFRPNEVIFSKGVSSFERTVLLTDDASFKYPKAQALMQSFGKPERIIRGSKVYGYNVSNFIYPNTGLAFIAEEESGNVFEVQTFVPLSLDQYITSYGQDIQEVPANAGGAL